MFEAYKVGVTLSVTNKVSSVLTAVASDFAKTDRSAKALLKTLHQLNGVKLIIAGGILGGAGLIGLHQIGKAYRAAAEYSQALTQFKALNLGKAINNDADQFARGTNVFGASATELIRTVRDLHTALGDYSMARALAPQIAQLKFANQAVFGDKGLNFDATQLRAMEKIIEMMGGFKSPAAFMAQANMMQQVVSGTGGMVQPTDYLHFIRRAGVSGRLLSSSAFYYTMEPLIQEMGGSTVGSGLMSAYNNLAQGRSTVRAAKEMMRLGILDPRMVEFDKIGHIRRILPGALTNTDEYASNPYGWMQDVLLPAMRSHGITTESGTLNEMGTLFGNRRASNLFSLMFLQQAKIAKNMGISMNAMGSDQLIAMARKSPIGAQRAFAEAENRFATALGGAPLVIATKTLLGMTTALNLLSDTLANHPSLAYALGGIATVLSTLAVGGGGLLMVAGAMKLIGPAFAMLTGLPLATSAKGLGLLVGGIGTLTTILMAFDHASDIGKNISGTWMEKYNPFIWAEKAGETIGNRIIHDNPGRYGFAPPSTGGAVQVRTHINLDGRRIATAVTDHQYYDMNRDLDSGSGFDSRLSFTAPGMP